MKAQRERELRSRRTGGQQTNLDWTIELKLDKDGGVRPILSNLILSYAIIPTGKAFLGTMSSPPAP
jgi:hypothetical protein